MMIVNEQPNQADQNQANVRKLASIVFKNLVLTNLEVSWVLKSKFLVWGENCDTK